MGIKRNMVYRGILVALSYLLGFVTFPYVTRTLGADGFGRVSFALSTADWLVTVAFMGVMALGVREVAVAAGDPGKLKRVFSEIFGLNLAFTLGACAICCGMAFFCPGFREIRSMLLVGIAKILFMSLQVEWLFMGLERFRFLTIANLSTRLLYVAAVFLFVRAPGDAMLYFILTVGMAVANGVVNFATAVGIAGIDWKHLLGFRYVKAYLRLGVFSVMSQIYGPFSVVLFGLLAVPAETGYYSVAVKFLYLTVNLFSAYTGVVSPRMATASHEKDKTLFSLRLRRSYALVFSGVLPLATALAFAAEPLTMIVAGGGYATAVHAVCLAFCALPACCFTQVVALHGLVPLGHERTLARVASATAVVSVFMNLIAVPLWEATGGAAVLLLCETGVATTYWLLISKRGWMPLPEAGDVWRQSRTMLYVVIWCVGIKACGWALFKPGWVGEVILILLPVILYVWWWFKREMAVSSS